MLPSVQQAEAIRAELWDAGYRPVPIYNPGTDHPSAGKAPMGAAWGDEARADPPAAVTRPADARARNTGVLCDGLRAIDVDIDNADIAHRVTAAVLARFGEAPLRYRRNSPRVLILYRAAAGAPPKRVLAGSLGKVEVLGRGQQFVAFGAHPSGAPIEWRPEPPTQVARDSLPAIAEADIDALFAELADLVQARPPAPPHAAPQAASPHGQAAEADRIVRALAAIPNIGPPDWEAWNRIGMATWAASSGSEWGRAAWHAWSSQHPAYDAAAANERWDHYRTSPPTQIGAGTLLHLARPPRPDAPDGQYGHSRQDAPQDAPDTAPVSGMSAPARTLPVVYFRDIRPTLDVADFVEGLLVDQSMSVVYGQSGTGKTFYVLDIALHVALGLPLQHGDTRRAVEPRGVLWLAMEGEHGAMNRVMAWCKEHEISAEDIPFGIVPVSLNLLDPEGDTGALLETMQAVAARFEIPVGWVVVDTLSRAMAGGNENAPDDMGALVNNGTRLQQLGKVALTWIHHSGKDEARGARGHSLLRAATDTEIEITVAEGRRTARVTKQREMECAGDFSFTLKVVELGVNKRGKPVTSCVVEGCDDGHTAGAVLSSRLKGHNRRALDVLTDLIAASGKVGFDGVPAGIESVPEKWWRDNFFDRTIDDGLDALKQESKAKAFARAGLALMDARLIGLNKGRAWLTRAGQPAGQKAGQHEQ